MVKVILRLAVKPMEAAEAQTMKKEMETWQSYGNYGREFPPCARLALSGDREAMFECGQMLFNGWGTEENKAAALVLFSRLTTAEFPLLNFYLGLYYEQGLLVGQDYGKAFRYFAAGAKAGDPLCLTQLGTMYGKGNHVKKDPVKAADYYRRASEGGDVLGTSNLAWCYANGEGMEKDLKKALELYEYAASEGEAHAMDELAHFREYYGRPEGETRHYNRLDIKIFDSYEANELWDLSGYGGRVADIYVDGQYLRDMLLKEEEPYKEKTEYSDHPYGLIKASTLYDFLMEATEEGTYANEFGVHCCTCPACGEWGCNDVSFHVMETEDSVIWYGFHHENKGYPYHLRFRLRKRQYARQMRRLKNAENRPLDTLPDTGYDRKIYNT